MSLHSPDIRRKARGHHQDTHGMTVSVICRDTKSNALMIAIRYLDNNPYSDMASRCHGGAIELLKALDALLGCKPTSHAPCATGQPCSQLGVVK